MSTASLLYLTPDARRAQGFVFDHDQLHREMTVSGNADRATLLDPAPIAYTSQRAGNWHFDHQWDHDNFNLAFFGFKRDPMADSNLAEPASLAWWTFVNHQQHYLAQNP